MDFHFLLRLRQPIIHILNFGLFLILGYGLMYFGLLLNSKESISPTAQQKHNPTHSSIQNTQQLNIHALLNNPLFGQAKTKVSEPVTQHSNEPLPETKLNLTLQGTLLFTEDRKHAKAIIAGPDGASKSYGLNEKKPNIPGGAHLENIYADHVILSRNNQQESLHLKGKKDHNNLLQISRQSQSSNTPKIPVTSNAALSSRLADYRNKILKQPALMGEFIRISPAQRDGQFLGYTLKPGKQKALFEEAGLYVGDILTHLNGEALDSPLKGVRALQQLAEARLINLTVLRQGISISLSLSLE